MRVLCNKTLFLWILICRVDFISTTTETYVKQLSVLPTPEPEESKNCTQMQFYCESCSSLVMCVDSDYGFMKQQLTCPNGTSCPVGKCSHDRNPLCDGTADIPFQCHVTGIFPDPFDCRKYHNCVPKSDKIINDQMELIHYKHQCQNDGNTEYKFDPKSTYCKSKLDKGCTSWPVPLCDSVGDTGALVENNSIFYVCDLVHGHLYPHLYVCPHGEIYETQLAKCSTPNILPEPEPEPEPEPDTNWSMPLRRYYSNN